MQFWAFGTLGSFTTFSAFSLDVVRLVDAGHPGGAAGYVLVSMVGGLWLALLGQRLATATR
jgi:CrcB protein